MDGENHERVARDVAQNSFEYANGRDIRQPVGENEGGHKACDTEEGTGDKNPEVLPEIVVHDAEIWVGNFKCCVKNECSDGCGYYKAPGDAFCPFCAEFVADRFLAKPTTGKEKQNR